MFKVEKFGAGANASFVHPFVIVALFITVVLILLSHRKQIIVAVLSFLILIPIGQQFYIGGVHLFVSRIIILVGLIRVMSIKTDAKEQRFAGGWNVIDKSFLLYVFIQSIAFSLQYLNFSAVINQVGFIWDTLGGYLLIRLLIFDSEDIDHALKWLSYIFALLAVSTIIEQIYLVNPFGYIGGRLEVSIREDSIRSFASFQHPLTSATSGAVAFPLFLFHWYRSKKKGAAVLGMIASTILVINGHSSGPLIAYVTGIAAILFWPVRKSMRLIRRTVAISILLLHLVMKAPVWFLIARIDLTGSSSSYHRAVLIDRFIKNFWEWWIIGTPNNYKWHYDLWDVQNQYVSVGVEGGLGAFICFIAIIVHGFSMIGNALERSTDEQQQRCLWVIGAALFSYMIAMLGVNLFDQSKILWFLLLAIISVHAASISTLKNQQIQIS